MIGPRGSLKFDLLAASLVVRLSSSLAEGVRRTEVAVARLSQGVKPGRGVLVAFKGFQLFLSGSSERMEKCEVLPSEASSIRLDALCA